VDGECRVCRTDRMCGKCTAQASWREVVMFSQPLTGSGGGDGADHGGEEGRAPQAAKAVLSVNWQSAPEPKKPRAPWKI